MVEQMNILPNELLHSNKSALIESLSMDSDQANTFQATITANCLQRKCSLESNGSQSSGNSSVSLNNFHQCKSDPDLEQHEKSSLPIDASSNIVQCNTEIDVLTITVPNNKLSSQILPVKNELAQVEGSNSKMAIESNNQPPLEIINNSSSNIRRDKQITRQCSSAEITVDVRGYEHNSDDNSSNYFDSEGQLNVSCDANLNSKSNHNNQNIDNEHIDASYSSQHEGEIHYQTNHLDQSGVADKMSVQTVDTSIATIMPCPVTHSSSTLSDPNNLDGPHFSPSCPDQSKASSVSQKCTHMTFKKSNPTNLDNKLFNATKQSLTDSSSLNNEKSMSNDIKPFSSIPGPWPSLPFIGTGWQYFYLVGRYDLSKLHEAHIDKYHTYGPILKEEYQWKKAIVHIYDPVDFETVFRSQGRCPVRPPNEFVSRLRTSLPDRYPNVGLANLNGEKWFEQRHKLAPAIMKLKTINENMSDQNEICDDFLKYIWAIRDPQTNVISNLQEAAYRLALESICMMCLDSRIGSLDMSESDEINLQNFPECSNQKQNDGNILIEATKLLFDSFNKLYYGLPFWKYFSTSAYGDLERAESTIYDVASKYVEKAIHTVLNDDSSFESKASVLQTMLNTKGLSKEDVKITIIDFISGGIFTVSNTLVYLFYHLAANSQVQEKLYNEIEEVMKTTSTESDMEYSSHFDSDKITSAHLAHMPYLKACVRECFRLNCPVPGIMRVTSKPMVLSGYNIPENTIVFSHLMATCRLEEYFKDANKFRPERWIDPQERSHIHPFALLPFGFGNRMCVGKRFSENEIYLTAAKLIRAFKIELAPGQEELELKHAFIVIPARPISLRITPRNETFT